MIKAKTIEEYIRKSNREFQGVAKDLRKIILRSFPRMKEEIKWNMPCYSFEGKNVCYFCITKDHVGLGFYDGKFLTDPTNLLRGEGKKLRQMNIWKVQDLKKKIITGWIREAAVPKR